MVFGFFTVKLNSAWHFILDSRFKLSETKATRNASRRCILPVKTKTETKKKTKKKKQNKTNPIPKIAGLVTNSETFLSV